MYISVYYIQTMKHYMIVCSIAVVESCLSIKCKACNHLFVKQARIPRNSIIMAVTDNFHKLNSRRTKQYEYNLL